MKECSFWKFGALLWLFLVHKSSMKNFSEVLVTIVMYSLTSNVTIVAIYINLCRPSCFHYVSKDFLSNLFMLIKISKY